MKVGGEAEVQDMGWWGQGLAGEQVLAIAIPGPLTVALLPHNSPSSDQNPVTGLPPPLSDISCPDTK